VLIVDDQPDNLLALEAVLRPLQLNVVRAGSGEEALRKLLHEDFAAILLDVQMPEMDGFETAQLIKQRERTQHIPIIFLTAIDKEQHQVFRGYSVGAVDYLFKPFDPEVLRSKVGIFVDLYEKNAALQESEERFRTAFANAPIGIGLMSTDGTWLEVNRALSTLLGHPASELVGKAPWELAHPRDRATERQEFKRMLSGNLRGFQGEKRYMHKDGHIVYTLLSVSLAHDGEGKPRGAIWQVVDITERKLAEIERSERERERAARAEAEAVADTIQKIQRVTDAALEHLAMDDLLGELVLHITDILQVDAAAILLRDQEEDVLTVGASHGAGKLDSELRIPVGEGFAGRIAGDGRSATIADGATGGGIDPLMAAGGVRSLLGVPLRLESGVSGVIEVGSRDARQFSKEDESLLQLMADRAALAIDHARLYARELNIVETLQRSLLPDRLPNVPGLRIAAKYMPGGPGADVGGDWYDAIPLDGGRLGMAMGDVVGHGIGAAALMGQLRNALRAYAVDGHSPGAVVARLDKLVQDLEAGRMATLIYLVIEPDLGSIRFASAGHLPPLIMGPDGDARFLEGGRSLPLGVMPGLDYAEATAEIEAGSTLVLYTDGLVEERGASIDAGLEALRQAVIDGPAEPEALCDHIVEQLLANRPATDDIAVLALRTVAMTGEHLHLDLPTNPKTLTQLRRTLARWLEGLGARGEESHDIQVSCHEAASNAMEHGYRFREAVVEVDASFSDGDVSITVADKGGWREKRDNDRGRGLEMIRALMDSVDVDPGVNGTTVRMRRRLAGPDGAPADAAAAAAVDAS
jgi:PAS domain S-box-containing protein